MRMVQGELGGMSLLWLWLTRPLWVSALALVVTAGLGLHGSSDVACLSAVVASVSFIGMLVHVRRLAIDKTHGADLQHVFRHFRLWCMVLLWFDHLVFVLGSLVVWLVLRAWGWSVWTVRVGLELDGALVVVLMHIVSMLFQLYVGKGVSRFGLWLSTHPVG